MKRLLMLFCFCLATAASAAEPAPDELVRTVTNEVLEIVRGDAALRAGDPDRVLELVHDKVLPHFDFRRMTMLAVGRDWRNATPEQQNRLVDAFLTLLVRTYSNALTQYRDQTVAFLPLRMAAGETRVQVRTEVRQPGAQPIAVDYMLEKKADDSWKVFDVIVAGVSLVTNYRSNFAEEVRVGGIDGLIRSLEAKNRTLAAEQAQS